MLTALLPVPTSPTRRTSGSGPVRRGLTLRPGRSVPPRHQHPDIGRGAWRALPLAAAALATVVGMVAAVGPEGLAAVLGSTDTTLMLGAVTVQVLALACLANLYRSTHGAVRALPAGDAGAGAGTVALAAFGLTQALPGGGIVGGALAMRRFQQFGSSPVAAASTVAQIGLLSLTGLCLVVTVALGGAAVTTGRHAGAAAAGLVLCALLVGGLVLAGRTGLYERVQVLLVRRVAWLLARRSEGHAQRFCQVAGEHGTVSPLLNGRLLARPLAWSIGKWALDLSVLTLVVRAVGGTASLAAIAAAYAAVNLLNSIPLTPGGLGLVEGGLSASLLAAGLDLGTAAAATLAYRAVSYWLPLAASVPAALHHLAAARDPIGRDGAPVEHAVPRTLDTACGPHQVVA